MNGNHTTGQIYSKIEDLYAYMRDKRGYDSMDEYIREDVLLLSQEDGTYGVDIPKNVWHGLECLEPSVLLECKEGPFVEHEIAGILEINK